MTPQDPTLPHQVAGVARGADGFRARLTVEFPGTMLPSMFAEHGWHLACEFSNWIEAANYGVTPDPVADRLASRGDREP